MRGEPGEELLRDSRARGGSRKRDEKMMESIFMVGVTLLLSVGKKRR